MKNLVKNSIFVLALAVSACSFSSCEEEVEPIQNNDETYKAILNQFVETTIVPTYKSLAEAALKMRTANENLRNSPSDATMQAASDAWMEARIWWEISEAFLFGPVGEDAFDIDGHIDSWPLELDAIKESIDAGGNITGATAWKTLDAEVIGFHVTEYLLYRNGTARPVNDLSEAERKYLLAATDALVWDCVLAYVAWVGEDKVSAEIRDVFNENPDVVDRLNENVNFKNFADKMKSASAYSGFGAAVEQIVDGAIDIADEVGTTKIEAPYNNGKVEEVESWYSWHSLDDYKNNIESIKNAYLGGVNNSSRPSTSLSQYVASKNATLDSDIKAKIAECIEKIGAIGGGSKSFYEVVRDQINNEQVEAAVDACGELAELFEKIKEYID
jgi:predicted lipoprotein